VIDAVDYAPNNRDITVTMNHCEDGRWKFYIPAGHALIDRDGVIRLFSIDWKDKGTANYQLLPTNATADHVATWIASTLAGFGLSRMGANIFKGTKQVDHITRYLAAGVLAAPLLNSFIRHHFHPSDTGYFNMATHECIFPGGSLHAPAGSW
jgi:hypothetical protein